MMKKRAWIIGWFAIVAIALILIGIFVYTVDPYFHYHKPYTDRYYYILNNQRSQNDGISKYFEYDALITGTSMTENFKTSELDEMFGVASVKVSYSGGTYKEINDNLKKALKYNSNLKMIIRGLDIGRFFDSPDKMREDLGKYPTYLYDENPFNDVNYLFNKDVIFSRAYKMTQDNDEETFTPGITPFDNYSRWQENYTFGINTVMPDGITFTGNGNPVHLTEEEKDVIYDNITQNVTSSADEYPDTEFYYFFTPYSILRYKDLVENGMIYREIEAEQYVIELILEHPNIKLFAFNGIEEIVCDINNYKDTGHYAEWVNSFMLRCMRENKYRLTRENYHLHLEEELKLYTTFDYESLNEQTDYSADFYSAALWNEFIWKVKPINIIEEYKGSIEISNAEFIEKQYNNAEGIRCRGSLQRSPSSEISVEDYISSTEYIGAKVHISEIGKHNYLVFYGKKIKDQAQPLVLVYNSSNNKVGEISTSYNELDTEWQQYVINLSNVEGDIIVYFNGGYVDNTGSVESEYIFSNITLY